MAGTLGKSPHEISSQLEIALRDQVTLHGNSILDRRIGLARSLKGTARLRAIATLCRCAFVCVLD